MTILMTVSVQNHNIIVDIAPPVVTTPTPPALRVTTAPVAAITQARVVHRPATVVGVRPEG